MTGAINNTPPDIKLIEGLIKEFMIASRNISIYPGEHPAVQKSMNQVLNVFNNIFELRPVITFAVGIDALIVDNYTLDKKNPAYKQFSQQLKGLNIAYITFSHGLSSDELYRFSRIIHTQAKDISQEDIPEIIGSYDLSHIGVGFVDYEVFSFQEGKTANQIPQNDLWELYIKGILTGTIKTEEVSEEIKEMPLDAFFNILSRLYKDSVDRAPSKKIIAIYIRKFFQRPLSNKEIKKFLSYISEMPPDLAEQFLSTVVETLSKDIPSASVALGDISADLVMELFEATISQKIAIPDNLKNLFNKLLHIDHEALGCMTVQGHCIVDDISLPLNVMDKLSNSKVKEAFADSFETSVSEKYQEEIKKIMEFGTPETVSIRLPDLKNEIDDDVIAKTFNRVILELMSSDIVSEKEYIQFIENLKEQTAQFLWTGQYKQILEIIKLLQLNIEKNRFSEITSDALRHYHTQEFFSTFLDSLKIMGRQARDEAWKLCEYFGDLFIPFLMDALINEDSQTFRSLLMSLIKQYGDLLVPEALNRLDDSRWFVKRNMLYLLSGCKKKEIIPYVKNYCHHENNKVSLEAVKCLLSLEDQYGLDIIRENLRSGSEEEIERGITLSGDYRVREVVHDLVQIIRRGGMSKTDVSQKIAVIQALGNIADPASLEAFREIIFSRSIPFLGGGREKLKEEIYRNLRNYPYEYIEDIVQAGLKSRNAYIKGESLRLSRMRTQ
ncbi:MAG: HEAT repeat domain-containing protein [Nitrospirae bacterium]|nr:HEAT repeat domain-containing protein [Nitrospirota bacterium]